jgi:hypothetical protein
MAGNGASSTIVPPPVSSAAADGTGVDGSNKRQRTGGAEGDSDNVAATTVLGLLLRTPAGDPSTGGGPGGIGATTGGATGSAGGGSEGGSVTGPQSNGPGGGSGGGGPSGPDTGAPGSSGHAGGGFPTTTGADGVRTEGSPPPAPTGYPAPSGESGPALAEALPGAEGGPQPPVPTAARGDLATPAQVALVPPSPSMPTHVAAAGGGLPLAGVAPAGALLTSAPSAAPGAPLGGGAPSAGGGAPPPAGVSLRTVHQYGGPADVVSTRQSIRGFPFILFPPRGSKLKGGGGLC